jgi:hypothetical protein
MMLKLYYKENTSAYIHVVMLLETKYIGVQVFRNGRTDVYVDGRYTEPEDMAGEGMTELNVT